MPGYIVTLKDDASPEDVASAKQHAVSEGGTITHEYTLIKAFAVNFPQAGVHTLDSSPHVKAVEADQEIRTQ